MPDGNRGGKFSLAAAYRGDDLSLLTNNRLKLGHLYTPANSELEGELRLAYEAGEVWFFRAGVPYKLSDGVFTGQVGVGATWYWLDNLGLEGGASYGFSNNSTSSLLLGLGASLRLAPGLSIGTGFNFETFGVGVTNYLEARPGLYLRLDWKFDERSFGR